MEPYGSLDRFLAAGLAPDHSQTQLELSHGSVSGSIARTKVCRPAQMGLSLSKCLGDRTEPGMDC